MLKKPMLVPLHLDLRTLLNIRVRKTRKEAVSQGEGQDRTRPPNSDSLAFKQSVSHPLKVIPRALLRLSTQVDTGCL